MTLARPPVVGQAEWDAALAAMTEREETVAAELWSLTPYGAQADDEDAPEGWPKAPDSFWFRRHDEFDEPPPSALGGARPQ